jgi:dihydropteroate synthase
MSEKKIKLRRIDLRNLEDVERLMMYIGVDDGGIEVMAPKTHNLNLLIEGVKPPAGNVLKQEMLSIGGECAIARDVIMGEPPYSSVLLIGNLRQLSQLVKKLHYQPFWGLGRIADMIDENVKSELNKSIIWKIKDDNIEIGNKPYIMGILNVTPDSFYDGGEYNKPSKAIECAQQMIDEGASIIDIGGVSTRPGSTPPPEKEELERVIPVVEEVSRMDTIISVDTYRSGVAEKALKTGAHIINDISALRFDKRMKDIVKDYGAGLVLMHMQGTPEDMQDNPEYSDVVFEVSEFFRDRINYVQEAGIDLQNISLDVGIGFGKELKHNLELIGGLENLKVFNLPLVIGASRKSLFKKLLGYEKEERLLPSVITAVYSFLKGANIIRVHDVKETVDSLKTISAFNETSFDMTLERIK